MAKISLIMMLLPIVFVVHEYEEILCLGGGLIETGKN